MRVAVTGATGFVGAHVCGALLARRHEVRALVRPGRAGAALPGCEVASMPDLDGAVWEESIRGCDAIVHLAARVHRSGDDGPDAYRRENVEATRSLARAARDTGVRRIVFTSTVKVFGERSTAGGFRLGDRTAPDDPYGTSKLEAERELERTAQEDGLQVAIVRPPLVYGPGVRANFLRLLRQIERGWPVPVSDTALRSLVFVGNLAELCAHLVTLPISRHQTFLVADGPPLSTRELVERLARAFGKRARTIRVPTRLASALDALPAVGPVFRRLTSSLALDVAESFENAGWNPPFDVDAALAATVAWYRTGGGR